MISSCHAAFILPTFAARGRCTLAVMGFGMYSYAAAEAQQRQHTVRLRPGQAAQGFKVGADSGLADGAERDENAPLLPTSTQASSGAWGTHPSA